MIFKSADIDIEVNDSHEEKLWGGKFLLWPNKTMVNSVLIDNIIEIHQCDEVRKKLLVLSKKIFLSN